MTPKDREILSTIGALVRIVVIFAAVGEACVSASVFIANYAITFTGHTWLREFLSIAAGFSPWGTALIVLILLVGKSGVSNGTYGRKGVAKAALGTAMVILSMIAMISAMAHIQGWQTFPEEFSLSGQMTARWQFVANWIFLVLIISALAIAVALYLWIALKNVMRYSLLLSIGVSSISMIACCFVYAFITSSVLDNPNIDQHNIVDEYYSLPSLAEKSPGLKHSIQTSKAVTDRINGIRHETDPILRYLQKHVGAFTVEDGKSRIATRAELALYYGDVTISIVSFGLADALNIGISNVQRDRSAIGAGLLVWSFQLLIVMLFVPVVSQSTMRLLGLGSDKEDSEPDTTADSETPEEAEAP